ncbi:uncharacterized protein LOC117006631 [Catharus ustulatus]|uniref:uncharacterized protein LOC117006631 n=1 Tax=Catharus ustulatus TaxID=91951 RepID=UPI00140A7FA7|nr:uncharacterized protein LOC117006631 [Catharus ustulatus]
MARLMMCLWLGWGSRRCCPALPCTARHVWSPLCILVPTGRRFTDGLCSSRWSSPGLSLALLPCLPTAGQPDSSFPARSTGRDLVWGQEPVGPVRSCPVRPWRCFGAEPPRVCHRRAGVGEATLLPASAAPGSQGRRCLFPWQPGPHVTPAKLDTPVPRETLPRQSPPACQPSPDSPVTACPHTNPESHRGTHSDAATITELCSENVPEVEIISLLGEQLPRYTLRADTVFSYDHSDWLRAPTGPPQPVAPLTPQQIEETLQYFRELVRVVGTARVDATTAWELITANGIDGLDFLTQNIPG